MAGASNETSSALRRLRKSVSLARSTDHTLSGSCPNAILAWDANPTKIGNAWNADSANQTSKKRLRVLQDSKGGLIIIPQGRWPGHRFLILSFRVKDTICAPFIAFFSCDERAAGGPDLRKNFIQRTCFRSLIRQGGGTGKNASLPERMKSRMVGLGRRF